MTIFGLVLCGWILVMSTVQAVILWSYAAALSVRKQSRPTVSDYPPAVVVLCLRGHDPFLRDCISRLLNAEYPDLTVRIVVDSMDDPALPVVRALLNEQNTDRAELMVLPERLPHCSGKVSGLLYATETLPDQCQVVAWIDGDSLLHRTTLKELVDGLHDPLVGAVSGNRWYLPPDASLSGLTRMLWNGFAVPTMNLIGILWGGCMATHASDMRNPELRRRLAESFIEDSTVASYVRSTGRRTRMIPSAMLLNRETISLKNYYRFATRQLFTVRIDNSRWPWIALHMFALNLTLLLSLIPMAMPWLPWWKEICLCYLVLLTTTVAAVPVGHANVRRILEARGETVPRLTVAQWILMPVALMMPNQLNLMSAINTFFIRQLTWRGITYRFGRSPKCTIINVTPMASSDDPVAQSVI